MATWKKIIVSGSDPHLNNITGSGTLKLDNLSTTESLLLKPLVIDSNGDVYKGSGSISSSNAITASYALTASYISSTDIDGQVGFPYSGSDVITGSTSPTPSAAVITGSLVVGGGLGGNITASGAILADAYFISQSGTKLADVSGSVVRLNQLGKDLEILASSLNLSASGGITASIIQQTTNPPFILAQTSNDELVKVPLGSIGSSGDANTVNNNVIDNFTTCSDNTNINLTVTTTATSEVETLIGQIIINDVTSNTTFTRPDSGTDVIDPHQFIFVPGTGYTSGSINAGDTVRIKNNASSVIGGSNLVHQTTINSIFSPSSTDGGSSPFTSSADTGIGSNFEKWDSTNDRLISQYLAYDAFHSASLATSLTSNDIYEEGQTYDQTDKTIPYRSNLTYFLYKITAQSSTAVEICLNENLSVNDITQSGDLYFNASGSPDIGGIVTESIHEISYYGHGLGAGTGSLNITASNIQVDSNINVDGTLSFDGFTFSDGNVLVTTGSNTFGTSSLDKHTFTGSLFVSGNINLSNDSKLFGTASIADSSSAAITASYAVTSSYAISSSNALSSSYAISSSNALSSSYAISSSNALSSSYAISSSNALSSSYAISSSNAFSASFAISSSNAFSASYAISSSNAFSSSYAISSSNAFSASNAFSSSFAITASYISASNIDGLLSGVGFPYSGSDDQFGLPAQAIITGSLFLSGSGHITASGNVKVKENLEVDGDITVHGNMIVSGTQTTIHTENLTIEDRFIVLGSGSKATADLDVGIIFDSGSVDGGGMGLFFDASANRLAIGTNLTDYVISNTSSNFNVGNPLSYPDVDNLDSANAVGMGRVAGNIMTIRTTGSLGKNFNTASNHAGLHGDVKLGKGEMVIDNENDIWIYV